MLSHRLIESLRERLLETTRSEKGSVFVMVAIASMMLIISTGAAVDMARAQVLQAKIQTALDAAGLAAGSTANSINVQTQAQKYFTANFPTGYLGSGTVTLTATLSADRSTVTLAANTTQATTFMKVIGVNSVSVKANTQITRANLGMELVFVLDNTGSMSTVLPGDNKQKIQALKDALVTTNTGLLDILYGSTNNTVEDLWVGVVPFTDMVNIGNPPVSASGKNWLNTTFDSALEYGPVVGSSSCPNYTGTSPATSGTHSTSGTNRCAYTLSNSSVPFFGQTSWGGCVLARNSTYEQSDQIPSTSVSGSLFQEYNYASDAGNTLSGTSPNQKCSGGSNGWMCHQTTSVTSGGRTTTTTKTIYNVVTPTTGPNLNCVATVVQPMVAEKNTIVSKVNSMVAGGSTMINLGVNWGYRMLSPNWNGWWGGEMASNTNTNVPLVQHEHDAITLPLPYRTALMNKVLILMTDGMNQISQDNNGNTVLVGSAYQGQTLPTNATQANTQLDNWTKNTCDAMKANGIIIYAIGFGTDDTGSSSTSVNGALLKYCATQNYAGDTSHYFLATTSVSLSSVFQQIGSELANLRVSQ